MAPHLFGRGNKSTNSDLADDAHASAQSKVNSPPSTQDDDDSEDEANVVWAPMKGFPLFEIDTRPEDDDDWDNARCTICKREFTWDNWGDGDNFFMQLELHEIKEYMRQLIPKQPVKT